MLIQLILSHVHYVVCPIWITFLGPIFSNFKDSISITSVSRASNFKFKALYLAFYNCYLQMINTGDNDDNNQLLQLCTARTAWSDSVIKLVLVLFGKCTTLVITKRWPMETRQPCGGQWKAEKLEAFWRWPITRCFIKSDRAGLIIGHSINFRLTCNGEHWRAVQF